MLVTKLLLIAVVGAALAVSLSYAITIMVLRAFYPNGYVEVSFSLFWMRVGIPTIAATVGAIVVASACIWQRISR